MRRPFLAALAATAALPLAAQEVAGGGGAADQAALPSPLERWEADRAVVLDAEDLDLADFRWVARPVIVFAETDRDPAFSEQLEELTDRGGALAERDVVVIVDTDPDARSALRRQLRPGRFSVVLIGKDGEVKYSRPSFQTVRELSRVIDSMPMRQQEIRERRPPAAEG